jgi:hypothetical protein
MTGDRALLRLARLAGVASSYEDAWHERRPVAPETLRRVLAAMGIAAADERDVAQSIAALQEAEWGGCCRRSSPRLPIRRCASR